MNDNLVALKRLAILKLIADNDGEFGWYNVEIRMGMKSEFPVQPLPYAILKSLSEEGYLRTEIPEGQTHDRYFITDAGIQLLRELEQGGTG